MTHADHTPHLRLELLSQPRLLCGARDMVAAVTRRLGFDEIACGQIALAVDEALSNIMRHGYDDAMDRPIWLHLWALDGVDAQGVRIVIEDEGHQIEPNSIKGRDLDDIKPGGLGVHIIREVMDSAVYEKRSEGGMRLSLEKRLSSAEPATTRKG